MYAMDTVLALAIAAVVIVPIFDYTNGFHDASNIIATCPTAPTAWPGPPTDCTT